MSEKLPTQEETITRLCNRLNSDDPDFDDCSEAARWLRFLADREERLLALLPGGNSLATITIDNNTLRAANEGLRDGYLASLRENKELVAALEYIRDLGRDGASNKYARAQAKAERTLEALKAVKP